MYPVPQTRAILKTTWTGRTLNPWSRSAAKDLGLSFFSFHHCAQHCVPSTVAGMGHCDVAPSEWKRPHVLQKSQWTQKPLRTLAVPTSYTASELREGPSPCGLKWIRRTPSRDESGAVPQGTGRT